MTSRNCHFLSSPVVTLKAGGSLVQYKPLFSHDNKYLLVPCGSVIKVFSTVSGECSLTWKGHSSTVISIQTNPVSCIQVLSCSSDGIVIQWDPSDGSLLKTFNLNFSTPVFAFYAPDKNSTWFAVSTDKQDGVLKLYGVSLKEKKSAVHSLILHPAIPHQHCIAFGIQAEFVVGIHDNNFRVTSLVDRSYKRHKIATWKFTCVACHPSDYVVATGDNNGRILVWANFLWSTHPTRSIYHWHTLPVADLAFSAEGTYLYSGGGECVLVKWKIGSEIRNFLPRLGLPICFVTTSGDNKFVATSHVDNAIQLISSQNRVVQVYQGLTLGNPQHQVDQCQKSIQFSPMPVGLLYDPRTHGLVLNGRPGHLQFYQLDEDRQLFNLDIVGQNYATQERHQVIVNTDVHKAALDCKGTWLATVECRDDSETSPEIRLKFWKYNQTTQRFILSTNVYLPHMQVVNCLRFRPVSSQLAYTLVPQVVTTSDEKKFKFWGLTEKHDAVDRNKQECWNCELIASYKQLPAKDADYSEDGSLLAVVFGHIITLWTTETGSLKSTLCHSSSQDTILEVRFGVKSCSQLVICTTSKSVTIWNLLTLAVSWCVRVPALVLARDPTSEFMAIFTTDHNLFVFHPITPNPVYFHKSVSAVPIIAATFIPCQRAQAFQSASQHSSQLYFMNQHQELLALCEGKEEDKESSVTTLKGDQNIKLSPFAELITLKKSEPGIEEQKIYPVHGISGLKEINEILDVPSHALPPVAMICATLLSSLLIPKSKRGTDCDENMKNSSEIDNRTESGLVKLKMEVNNSDANKCVEKVCGYSLKIPQEENYDWLLH